MVYRKRKRTRRRRKRKTYRRKRRRSRIPRGINFVPKKRMVKLNYVSHITMDPSLGTAASYVFSANGLYDPNITGSGHQPSYFDTLMSLYNHYTVVGAKIRCTFISNNHTSAAGTCIVGCGLGASAGTSYTSASSFIEDPTYRYSIMTNGNANQKTTVSNTFSAKKYFTKAPLAEHDIRGDVASNPLEQAYFKLFAIGTDTSTNPAILQVLTKISYTAIFCEPRELVES